MKYRSTRASTSTYTFSEALREGLAIDSGLFVPESFPAFQISDFDGLTELHEIGPKLLFPFLEGDPLQNELSEIFRAAMNFPLPLVALQKNTSLLELFHGPTCAFKDVGARFLAESSVRLQKESHSLASVLVATSGDTGGAVASAFAGKKGIEVFILFPKGKVSARQEKQLCCWGGNVRAFAVRGDFDDCQRIVKATLSNKNINRNFLSANSINIGRLLPQMSYYAKASLEHFRKTNRKAGFVIPSGNLGNAMAALWTKKVGLPIGPIVLACNANQSLVDYVNTRHSKKFATVATLANAMDVGNPSNLERLIDLEKTSPQDLQAFSASDENISNIIKNAEKNWGIICCPHTATAFYAREKLSSSDDWILVSTAHPAKFESIVEPLIGKTVPLPESLKTLLDKSSQCTEIDANTDSFLSEIA